MISVLLWQSCPSNLHEEYNKGFSLTSLIDQADSRAGVYHEMAVNKEGLCISVLLQPVYAQDKGALRHPRVFCLNPRNLLHTLLDSQLIGYILYKGFHS